MATLIRGTAALFNIADGLDADPTTGSVGCDSTITITGDSDISTVACIGSVLKSQIAGAKTSTLTFSSSTLDAAPYPVDLFGSTGLAVGQDCSCEVNMGDTSDTLIKITGPLSSCEYGVDASGHNTISGTVTISAAGTWL